MLERQYDTYKRLYFGDPLSEKTVDSQQRQQLDKLHK